MSTQTLLSGNRNSFRVMPTIWMNEARTVELLRLLEWHPEIHEVAFFTSLTHAPLRLDDLCQRATLLEKAIVRFQNVGLSAGINHLATIGHLNENLEDSLNEPWQRLVDATGKEARGSFCLNDERMRDYTVKSYRMLAAAKPEFIWIDDDVRVEWHPPATRPCFCQFCLAKFNQQHGSIWERESLVAAFDAGPWQQRLKLRKAWLACNRDYITDTIATIRRAVDDVNPEIELGFMSSVLNYSGAGFDEWAKALSGQRSLRELPAKWRPGGGFYNDATPTDLLRKVNDIGAQVAGLPPELTDIQYEHENFPYLRASKSTTIFVAEIAAAIGAGCTGVALNVMGLSQGSLGEYDVYFERMQECTPFFDKAVATLGRSACEGIGFSFTPDNYASVNPNGNWLKGDVPNIKELGQIGLPLAYSTTGSRVTILVGDSVLQWSREQLMDILSGGVLMDGGALEHLTRMELGEYAGFSVAGTREHDAIERYSEDSLNSEYANWTRDVRPSFWSETTHLLTPLSSESRILSEIIDFQARVAGAGSGCYENALGGRVAVMGYYPWRMLNTLSKTDQLKSLCRWLARDTIPAYVESYAQCAIWCRRDSNERTALMLMNASLDAQPFTVRVLASEATPNMLLTTMDGTQQVLSAVEADNHYLLFRIERLDAWQAVLLTSVD